MINQDDLNNIRENPWYNKGFDEGNRSTSYPSRAPSPDDFRYPGHTPGSWAALAYWVGLFKKNKSTRFA